MKRIILLVAIFAAVGFVSGCFTSATATTKRTLADGTVTETRCTVIGTGDKVSQIAADGLFADGTDEDLGAGVRKASANQQSTGIDGTLTGLGTLMQGMATFMASAQGVKAATTAASPAAAAAAAPATAAPSTQSATANCTDGNCATPAAAK